MKVILTAEMHNLGKIGDVVSVKDGYAKNFLVPKKRAIYFTANNQRIFEVKRKEFEEQNAEKLAAAEALRNALLGKDVIIIENASDDGRLYGSVNSAVIAEAAKKILHGKSVVDRGDIFLAKPIKEIGVYQIALKPHSEVNFNIRLVVSRSESEVDAMINPKKAKEKKSDAECEEVEEKQFKKRAKKQKQDVEATEVAAG